MIIKIFLLCFILMAALFDIKHREIPGIFLLAAIVFGTVLCVLWGSNTFTDEIFGIMTGAVFIALSVISKGQIGMGDSLVILVIGVCQGGINAAFSCLYALFAACLVSVFLMVFKKYKKDHSIPFIPFLAAGVICQEVICII